MEAKDLCRECKKAVEYMRTQKFLTSEAAVIAILAALRCPRCLKKAEKGNDDDEKK